MNNYYFTESKWYGPIKSLDFNSIEDGIDYFSSLPSGDSLIPQFAGMVKEEGKDFVFEYTNKFPLVGKSYTIKTAVPVAEEKEFPDTYPDLSGVPNDKKDEIINTLVEVTAKNVLATFLALGLKEHITANVVNDATGDVYKFSFVKAEEGKQTFNEEERNNFAIGFAEWHNNLSPTQRCTVHPPAGSGSGYGLYQLSTEELLKKYLKTKQ